jgi:hypothetical protein
MTDLPSCDNDVFLDGTVVAIRSLDKAAAESYVKRLRQSMPSHFVDWHYVAGRAVFKALPRKDVPWWRRWRKKI